MKSKILYWPLRVCPNPAPSLYYYTCISFLFLLYQIAIDFIGLKQDKYIMLQSRKLEVSAG